jgi:hypothetical protein
MLAQSGLIHVAGIVPVEYRVRVGSGEDARAGINQATLGLSDCFLLRSVAFRNAEICRNREIDRCVNATPAKRSRKGFESLDIDVTRCPV